MNIWYLLASLLLIVLGLLHTVLGERLVIGPLVADQQLPKLLNSRSFMGRVLRFTWHTTTVALWGIGGLLIYWGLGGAGDDNEIMIVIITLLVCAAISAVVARLKHFSWWVFLMTAGLVWWGAQ